MSEKYSPKKGDRVRIVMEGEVVNSQPSDSIQLGEGEWLNYIHPDVAHVVSVEKLPDPIPTTPGTVLWADGPEAAYQRAAIHWFATGSGVPLSDERVQEYANQHGFTVLREGKP